MAVVAGLLAMAATWAVPGVAHGQEATGGSMTTLGEFFATTPGGPWMGQLLVSFFTSGIVLFTLRFSVVGLVGAAVMLPVSAYLMAAVGLGSFWLATMEFMLVAMTVLAYLFLSRRAT